MQMHFHRSRQGFHDKTGPPNLRVARPKAGRPCASLASMVGGAPCPSIRVHGDFNDVLLTHCRRIVNCRKPNWGPLFAQEKTGVVSIYSRLQRLDEDRRLSRVKVKSQQSQTRLSIWLSRCHWHSPRLRLTTKTKTHQPAGTLKTVQCA